MFQPRPLYWIQAGQLVSNSFVLSASQSSRTSNFNVFSLTRPGTRGHQPPACQANVQQLHYPVTVYLTSEMDNIQKQEKQWCSSDGDLVMLKNGGFTFKKSSIVLQIRMMTWG